MSRRTKITVTGLFFSLFLLLVTNTSPVSSQTGTTDWPMFMKDPEHTGVTSATFNPTKGTTGCKLTRDLDVSPCMQIKWKKGFTEWANGQAQPVVVGNTVFFANMNGKLYAYDTESGAERWVFSAGGGIAITPAVIDGRIYFGDLAGRFYGLNTTDGQSVFTPIVTRGAIYSSPVAVSENGVPKIFFGNNDGQFFGIDGRNGTNLFTPIDLKGAMIFSSPAYFQGKVYFAAENMYAYAINSTNGQEIWKQKLNGESNRGNHPVIVGSTNKVLFYTVPPYGNTTAGLKDRYQWGELHLDLSNRKLSDLLVAYQNSVKVNPATKSMHLFDAATGSEQTSFSVDGIALSMIPLNLWYANHQNYPLVMDRRYLIFGAFGGYVRLDTTNGQFSVLYTKRPVRGDEYTAAIIAGGYLYGGFYANVARLNISNSQVEQLHGCQNCGDPPPYQNFDQKLSNSHWQGITGDGGTDTGQYFIIGSNRAFWFVNGWLYAF